MIKNKIFKTTYGDNFLLAIGNNLKSFSSLADMDKTMVAGDIACYGWNSNQEISPLPFGTKLTADIKEFSFVQKDKNNIIHWTGNIPLEDMKCTFMPYADPIKQTTAVTLSTSNKNLDNSNQMLQLKVIDTILQGKDFARYGYDTIVSGTFKEAICEIIDAINNEGVDADKFFTAELIDDGADIGVLIKSEDYSRPFKVAFSIDPTARNPISYNHKVTIKDKTNAFIGCGTPELIKEMQITDNIQRGNSSIYTYGGEATPDEYGRTEDKYDLAPKWDLVQFVATKKEFRINTAWKTCKYFIAVPEGKGKDIAGMF